MAKKTDNHNAPAKLTLRRHFLAKYHADGQGMVLDCCQGGGVMWSALREEFEIKSYWGVDLKSKKGRLKIDSARILEQAGWPQNIIDVDVYGSPWKHWQAILANLYQPLTVFLTRGSHSLQTLDKYEKESLGLALSREIPGAFYPKLCLMDMAIRYCVARTCGAIITEVVEAVSDGNARYIGVRLEKRPAGVEAPSRPKQAKPNRRSGNV